MSTAEKADYWKQLGPALELLAKHQTSAWPFHCEHDVLYVMSDPSKYTEQELEQLSEWGFDADEGGEYFCSFRYGSA